MPEKRYFAIMIVVTLFMISAPYIVGFQNSNSQAQFGGFLINPIDGHSYLSKIQQGYRGEWKFRLPYTSEPGEGAYLFLFYLGLGHVCRLTQLQPIFIFHTARLLSALWLIFIIGRLLRALFNDAITRRMGLIAALFGSGLGWLAVLFGTFTSDFWVAEAYPFLSMYTNPHFPLGLGLMIHILLPGQKDKLIPNLLTGLLLGLIQPFAVVIISLVKIIEEGWKIIQERIAFKQILKARWFWSIVGFTFTGGIVVLYQYWAIINDPVLFQWHKQNITLKPVPLDLVVSLSPALIIGMIGAREAWKNKAGKTLVIWTAISLVLLFIPWSLQRRFLTGIYIPLIILAMFGLRTLSKKTPAKFHYWVIVFLFLAIPTNLMVITSGLQAISEKNPQIFLDSDLVAGLEWIDLNTEEDDLILADQKDGLYLPSFTGRKVIYGHPFETIQAEKEQRFLEEVFYLEQPDNFYNDTLEAKGVDFVLLNLDRADDFGKWLDNNWFTVFQSNEVVLYSRRLE